MSSKSTHSKKIPLQTRWAWVLRNWPRLEWPRIDPHRGFFVRIYLWLKNRISPLGHILKWFVLLFFLLYIWTGLNVAYLKLAFFLLIPFFVDEIYRWFKKIPDLKVTPPKFTIQVKENPKLKLGIQFKFPFVNIAFFMGYDQNESKWKCHFFTYKRPIYSYFPVQIETHNKALVRAALMVDSPVEGLQWLSEILEIKKNDSQTIALPFLAQTPGKFLIQGLWCFRILEMGLTQKCQYFPLQTSVHVIPNTPKIIDLQGHLKLEENSANAEDLVGIRPFHRGDRLRQLDMRSWARTQTLLTREYGQHQSEPLRVLLHLKNLPFSLMFLREGQIRLAAALVEFWDDDVDLIPSPWPKNWDWPADSMLRVTSIPVGFTKWFGDSDERAHYFKGESDWYIDAGLDQAPYHGRGFRIVPGASPIRWEENLCILPIRHLENFEILL